VQEAPQPRSRAHPLLLLPARAVSVAMCQAPPSSGATSCVPAKRGVLSLAWPSESTNTLVSGSLLSFTTERSSPCAGCWSSGRNMWIWRARALVARLVGAPALGRRRPHGLWPRRIWLMRLAHGPTAWG